MAPGMPSSKAALKASSLPGELPALPVPARLQRQRWEGGSGSRVAVSRSCAVRPAAATAAAMAAREALP
eukprot:11164019-Lingulodinium_polyedra.AAC.1